MKLVVKLLLAAAIPTTPVALPPQAAQDGANTINSHYVAVTGRERLNREYYVGSNACWFVDRRAGAISALSLDNLSPLWSKDGVVFRAATAVNFKLKDAAPPQNTTPFHATEAFGRVYFFLDAPQNPRNADSPLQYNALLVALDAKAQGRLAWKLNVKEFAPFFSPDERRELCFINKIKFASHDELIVQVQSAREIKRFALDAATGRPRFLESREISK